MNAQPTRRDLLSAVVVAPVAGATFPAPALATRTGNDHVNEMGVQLMAVRVERTRLRNRWKAARAAIHNWEKKNPIPAYAGDGSALDEWMARYRIAIENSGAKERHRASEAAARHHANLAALAVTIPLPTLADVQALARLIPYDCDGVIRDRILSGVDAL